MFEKGQIALVYGGKAAEKSIPANGEYPFNPNGSLADIAGICNTKGNVLGLMPHPENNVVIRERILKKKKNAQNSASICGRPESTMFYKKIF